MRIRMSIDVSGTVNGQRWPARGEEIDVSDQTGARMCAAGQAIPVPVETIETAVPDTTDVETREVQHYERPLGPVAIETREDALTTETAPEIVPLGGGWYVVNGQRVRGLKAAQEACGR